MLQNPKSLYSWQLYSLIKLLRFTRYCGNVNWLKVICQIRMDERNIEEKKCTKIEGVILCVQALVCTVSWIKVRKSPIVKRKIIISKYIFALETFSRHSPTFKIWIMSSPERQDNFLGSTSSNQVNYDLNEVFTNLELGFTVVLFS